MRSVPGLHGGDSGSQYKRSERCGQRRSEIHLHDCHRSNPSTPPWLAVAYLGSQDLECPCVVLGPCVCVSGVTSRSKNTFLLFCSGSRSPVRFCCGFYGGSLNFSGSRPACYPCPRKRSRVDREAPHWISGSRRSLHCCGSRSV